MEAENLSADQLIELPNPRSNFIHNEATVLAASLYRRTLADDEKYDLITSNLQEVIRGDIIREILQFRPLKIY